MRKFIVSLLVLALVGCAQTANLKHATKGYPELQKDTYDCEQVAYQTANNMGMQGNIFILRGEFSKCMNIKHGWYEE